MKIIKTFFLAFALTLLSVSNAFATPEPGDDGPGAPGEPQPRVPINQDIALLLMGGLVLGAVVVYNNKIKKASV